MHMGKLNRGETTKLSIRLTSEATRRIEQYAKNLNLSKAGVILFVLPKILEAKPTEEKLLELQETYHLERQHFVMTITKDLGEDINDIVKSYNKMKKNVFIGLLVSDHFESEPENELLRDDQNVEPVGFRVEINDEVKKKILNYSEDNYIPLSGLITYCILNGPHDKLPFYQSTEKSSFFTRIPSYVRKIVKDEALKMHTTEDFYVEICIYKAFMEKNKIFN